MNFLIRWLLNTAALLIVSKIMNSIEIDGFVTALVAAAILGIINTFLRPVLILLTLPINILTFGLFTLVINGLVFYLAGNIVEGFYIADFWSAFWGALIFSLINILITSLIFNDMNNVKGP